MTHQDYWLVKEDHNPTEWKVPDDPTGYGCVQRLQFRVCPLGREVVLVSGGTSEVTLGGLLKSGALGVNPQAPLIAGQSVKEGTVLAVCC